MQLKKSDSFPITFVLVSFFPAIYPYSSYFTIKFKYNSHSHQSKKKTDKIYNAKYRQLESNSQIVNVFFVAFR